MKIVDIKKKYNIGDSAVSKIVNTYGKVFEEVKGTKENPKRVKSVLFRKIKN
jgi:hypothetical protein